VVAVTPGLGLRLNASPVHADRPGCAPSNWAAVQFGEHHPGDEESQHDEYSDDPPHSNHITYRRTSIFGLQAFDPSAGEPERHAEIGASMIGAGEVPLGLRKGPSVNIAPRSGCR
jgi:hypothetical protein